MNFEDNVGKRKLLHTAASTDPADAENPSQPKAKKEAMPANAIQAKAADKSALPCGRIEQAEGNSPAKPQAHSDHEPDKYYGIPAQAEPVSPTLSQKNPDKRHQKGQEE